MVQCSVFNYVFITIHSPQITPQCVTNKVPSSLLNERQKLYTDFYSLHVYSIMSETKPFRYLCPRQRKYKLNRLHVHCKAVILIGFMSWRHRCRINIVNGYSTPRSFGVANNSSLFENDIETTMHMDIAELINPDSSLGKFQKKIDFLHHELLEL